MEEQAKPSGPAQPDIKNLNAFMEKFRASASESESSAPTQVPECVLFWHDNFQSPDDHPAWTIYTGYYYLGDDWNDQVSSLIIKSGTWKFYKHANFNAGYTDGPWEVQLGPGSYPNIPFPNDELSSVELVSW